MKFLSLLLGLVILVAILYQTAFMPMSHQKKNPQAEAQTTKAIQALKDAEKIKQMLNNRNQKMDYEEPLKNQ